MQWMVTYSVHIFLRILKWYSIIRTYQKWNLMRPWRCAALWISLRMMPMYFIL